ncbi:MAG: hypothetical protein HYV42_01680 [Candidatus Magasanikbacteria bacterium]|nr:hypothetical protein [Candidatus Magasanikbacteria bacterium]
MRFFPTILIISISLAAGGPWALAPAQAAKPAFCCQCVDEQGTPLRYPARVSADFLKGKTPNDLDLVCRNVDFGAGIRCSGTAKDCPVVDEESGCFTADNGYTYCALENPLTGDETNLAKIFGRILRYALGLLGALTLLMIVRGGHIMLTAAGNPEKIKKGTQTIMWAVIGVFLILASYFLMSRLISLITKGTV